MNAALLFAFIICAGIAAGFIGAALFAGIVQGIRAAPFIFTALVAAGCFATAWLLLRRGS